MQDSQDLLSLTLETWPFFNTCKASIHFLFLFLFLFIGTELTKIYIIT